MKAPVTNVPSHHHPSRPWAGHALVLTGYLLVSVVFSWPTACFRSGVLVTRHFDLFPANWLVERAPGTFPDMFHRASAYPFGESLARVDSYVLLALAWLNDGLLPAWILLSVLTLAGPVLSAFAAERCAALAYAVPRPWSWVAGLTYAFSGIAASALLEGHVHYLLNPWLPMLVWAIVKATAPGGKLRHALLAGLAWTLSLFTSAYFGVVATLLALVLGLSSGRRSLRVLPALLVVLPAGLYYVWLFSMGGRWSDGQVEPSLFLRIGTATVGGLATWSDATDLASHSISAPLGFTALSLMLMSPLVLASRKGWRAPLLLAIGALPLALGAEIRLDLASEGATSPLALLSWLPGLAFFRFPIRFMWIFSLCCGLLASMVLAALAERIHRRYLLVVMALALLDLVLVIGMPWRLRQAVGTVPGSYESAPENMPVLDLFGVALDRSGGELEMWTRNLGCYYQARHGLPVFELCIGTGVDSPRELVERWLGMSLLSDSDSGDPAGEGGALLERLQDLGVGSVVVHRDFMRGGDALLLEDALEDLLGPPTATSTDGGENLVLFSVPPGLSPHPYAAYQAMVSDLR